MKYVIVYLLQGEAKTYHKKLVKKLAIKFKEQYLTKNPVPSHATLKYSFETKKIKEIEELLKRFCKKHKSTNLKIRKINNLHKKIIYLQLDFSKEAIKIYRDLIKELKKVSWLRWRKYDKIGNKFHVTLIYGNIAKHFKEIWEYISTLKPKFDLKFNNIAILKKQKYWKIHKVFKIK